MTQPLHTLPELSSERLAQMIHFAASHRQEDKNLTWYQRWHLNSRRALVGIGATAVSFSCVGAFWLMPLFQVQQEVASDFTISEYMMQELLEELV